ncbi:MAG: stage II sporulation protein M, partial [Candidatus Aenigmarchaeota archaeon]|nr:stage II sporulation protein M [Candidatus Aenigmarchaeota archaeon]MDI6722321.1 stage II sporulation protein M [Candidatus Aenigmarchaeota archaeon]
TILFVPFFQKLFELEEEKEDEAAQKNMKGNLFVRHRQTIYVFSAFFLGTALSMTFVFVFFPEFNDVFSLQADVVRQLNPSAATGAAYNTSANFWIFFTNNSQVMMLVFIMSAIFGAGAVFVLAWNASIISVFSGFAIQKLIGQGVSPYYAFAYGLPVSLGSIALHGIPEVVAYFFAGLAGGVFSVGIIRENLESREFRLVLKDSLIFLAIAEIMIFAGAYIEAVF